MCAAGVRMHPWTELETDMPADFLFVFLISAAPALRRRRPSSCVFRVDGVTKSRTLVSYKVDISGIPAGRRIRMERLFRVFVCE